MRITILTPGTRGDVQPYIALGRGLEAAGHIVCLATGPEHEEFVRGAGMAFAPVRGRLLPLMKSVGAEQDALLLEQIMDCVAAVRGADVVLGGFTILGVARTVAEKQGVPFLPAVIIPFVPTRAFPNPVVPPIPLLAHNGLYNRLTYAVVPMVAGRRLYAALNRARRTVLDLAPLSQPSRASHESANYPTLNGYSPSVLPKPTDWDANQHVTGFWFDQVATGWQPPAHVVEFLSAGPPPVYFTFGSRGVAGLSPKALLDCIYTALRQSGQRGIVGLDPREVDNVAPDRLCLVPDISHTWLYPHVASVVHHGGVGNTGAALRAGLPAVIIPAGLDQHFWAWRVRELGVGMRGPRWGDGAKLGAALSQVLNDAGMRARAAALGARIRAEDGVGQAVAVIERALGA